MSYTQNTKISKSKLGPPRFDHDREVANPSEVVTYKMSQDEIKERYGHLPKPEGKKPIVLKWESMKTKQKEESKMEEMEIYNGHGKIVSELTKERYIELKKNGKTDSEIKDMYVNLYTNKLTKLKKEWGLFGVEFEQKKEANPVEESQFDGSEEKIIELERMNNEYIKIIGNLRLKVNEQEEVIRALKTTLKAVL